MPPASAMTPVISMNTQPPILRFLPVICRFIMAAEIRRTRKTFIQGEDSSSR
jgi:hypothetical protein